MSNYKLSNEKPEAALGYWIGNQFYPVHHGTAKDMLKKCIRIGKFEITSMVDNRLIVKRFNAAVLPYEMTV